MISTNRFVYILTIFFYIFNPITFCHVILTDRKSTGHNMNSLTAEQDKEMNKYNQKLFLEPIYEYPTVTKLPISSSSLSSATLTTPSPSPSHQQQKQRQHGQQQQHHSHIGKIPKKNDQFMDSNTLSVLLPEAIVYIGNKRTAKNSADLYGVPAYANKEAKNLEVLNDNSLSTSSVSASVSSSKSDLSSMDLKKDEQKDKVRYRDLIIALALWNLANTFNQYETGSYESADLDDLNGFQVDPISQEIKLRSGEILKFNKS